MLTPAHRAALTVLTATTDSNRSGHFEIWMVATDGSGARQMSHDGVDAENPAMTPDGKWVLHWSSNLAKRGIWKIRP